MLSVLAHELTETVTDPNLDAWMSAQGYENADMCAWTFGLTIKSDTNSDGQLYLYNMVGRNGQRFLVQQNWDRINQYCVPQKGL